MNCIYETRVNEIFECNLLHDKPNPSKHTKKLNSHYSPIIHKCMYTQNGGDILIFFVSYWIVYVVPQL